MSDKKNSTEDKFKEFRNKNGTFIAGHPDFKVLDKKITPPKEMIETPKELHEYLKDMGVEPFHLLALHLSGRKQKLRIPDLIMLIKCISPQFNAGYKGKPVKSDDVINPDDFDYVLESNDDEND